MEPIVQDTCFDDLPKLDKDIAHFCISGDIPAAQIAFLLKCSTDHVRKVLNNPVVSDYIERMHSARLFDRMDMVDQLTQTQLKIAQKISERVENDELSTKELIHTFEVLGDRLPNNLMKQSKQIHQSEKVGLRQETLNDLKSRSAGNIIEYKPKQVEVINE